MRRSTKLFFEIAVAAVAIWWIMRVPPPQPQPRAVPAVPGPTASGLLPLVGPASAASMAAVPKADDPGRSVLLDDLNRSGGTIQDDLRLLSEVFAAWRTNFPRDGNPVGENAEIVRTLTGANALNLALVPRDHPAINAAGELTDRWGTPFRLHQLSGTRMEIRSAGPDRRFGTADDALLTP